MASPSPTDDDFAQRLSAELPRLRAWLARECGPAAEDLVQETLTRAWRSRSRWDRARALRPWLDQTARAVLSDHRRTRRITVGDELPERSAPALPDALAEREALEQLLSSIEPIERECLVRFHQQGESIATIAQALGVPVGTVKSHLHRARRKLAERGEP
jgi:RNA polymerase sigma-70 factor, ECF subfamily